MLTLSDIQQAQQRINPFIDQTPVMSSAFLNQQLGHNILFKAECLQKVGAFKARGACNALQHLRQQGKEIKRVICNSSGNHAQAIAWSASRLNIPASIYMPNNVSAVKAQATQAYGAQLVRFDTRQQADEAVAEAAQQEGVYWIPPFNHPDVICGQGTAFLEAHQQLEGVEANAVFAPCGGGGLASGTLIAAKGLDEKIKVIGAEPQLGDDAIRSVQQGKIVRLREQPDTLADGAKTLAVGDLTLPYLQQLDGFYPVDEQTIAYWTQWLSHLLKLHVEPTSAMSMGAVIEYLKLCDSAQTVMVILTGGNIDRNMQQRIWQHDYLTQVPTL